MNSRESWIGSARPSRQPLRGFLRMKKYLNAIKDIPHAEERPYGPGLEARTAPLQQYSGLR